MPRDGAITFGDLVGKLDLLAVECTKCERAGRYSVRRLIEQRGPNDKIIDWKDALTADCPRKIANNMSDHCAARCPELPELGARRGPDKRWEQRLLKRAGLDRLGLKLAEYERYIDAGQLRSTWRNNERPKIWRQPLSPCRTRGRSRWPQREPDR